MNTPRTPDDIWNEYQSIITEANTMSCADGARLLASAEPLLKEYLSAKQAIREAQEEINEAVVAACPFCTGNDEDTGICPTHEVLEFTIGE